MARGSGELHTDQAGPLSVLPEEPAERDTHIPASALRERRGNRSQVRIAQAAGISQGYLSELEAGSKSLTPAAAQKLAPALGTTVGQLVLREHLAKLNRAAQEGHIDLQPLLAEAERLAKILPGGEVGDAIVDALIGIALEGPKPLV
jgi:transcriptional regulator with XRE-family HTH domain